LATKRHKRAQKKKPKVVVDFHIDD